MKRKKLLAGILALVAAGGIATTAALITLGDNGHIDLNVEDALYLNWGSGDNVADIPTLSETPEYRKVVLEKPATNNSNLEGYSKVTIVLDGENLDGVEIKVATEEFVSNPTPVHTFKGEDTSTYTYTHYVSIKDQLALADETPYTLHVSFRYVEPDVVSGDVAGTLDFALDYSATNN